MFFRSFLVSLSLLLLAGDALADDMLDETASGAAEDSLEETGGLRTVSMSGGLVVPWKGTSGPSFTFRFGQRLSPHKRGEVEFEFKTFEADIYGRDELDTDMFTVRGLIEYIYPITERGELYVGFGVGLSVIDFDDGFKSRILPNTEILSLAAIGLSLTGVAGAEYALQRAAGFALFVEGRIDHTFAYSWVDDLGKGRNDWNLEGLGGFVAQAGLRVRF